MSEYTDQRKESLSADTRDLKTQDVLSKVLEDVYYDLSASKTDVLKHHINVLKRMEKELHMNIVFRDSIDFFIKKAEQEALK